MQSSIIPIDVDLCHQHLELHGNDLIRTSGRFGGVITGKMVRVDNERYKTLRVKFAMKNNISHFGSVMVNDNNEITEISDSVGMLFGYSKYDKISTTHNGRYLARWTTKNGERDSKCFDSFDQAKEYQQKMFDKHWKHELQSLNLYRTYCNNQNKVPRSS